MRARFGTHVAVTRLLTLSFCMAIALQSIAAQQVLAATADKPYVVGPGDQLSVQVVDVEEFSGGKTMRIDDSGSIALPLMGRMEAGGLTVAELETAIGARLSKYVVKPIVVVSVTERRTVPVTVAGAVKSPGVLSITEGKTLFEVLALAGGALPDAGYKVRLTRRVTSGSIPVSGAHEDPQGQFFVADIPLRDVESGSSTDNVRILANDFISVPRAELIYVIGDVKRTGAFALAEGQTVSVLQAIAMAEGTLKTAAPAKASIKRVAGEDKRVDIPVDIDKIMKGKAPDEKLQAKDILVVPGSASQNALEKTISTILTIGTGVVVRLY